VGYPLQESRIFGKTKQMEFLVLFIIVLLIAILVLPFVALAKVNSAKRGVDNLATASHPRSGTRGRCGCRARRAATDSDHNSSSDRPRGEIGAAANPEKIRRRNRSSNHSACKTAD
jgi:hypothetical protein